VFDVAKQVTKMEGILMYPTSTHTPPTKPSIGHYSERSVSPDTNHSAYFALIQRGVAAGLSPKQIANALMETTGATENTVLKELKTLLNLK